MKTKDILIMIPADGKQRSRSITLPHTLKKLIPLGIGILTLLIGALVSHTVSQWHYIKQSEPQVDYVSDIENQLTDKNKEIADLKNQVETINHNLETIANLQNKISAMLNYDGITVAAIPPALQSTAADTGTQNITNASGAASLEEATKQTQIYLSAIENSYDKALIAYENKLRHIPSTLPLTGSITSYFGNRPDPFNSRKTEFHNGVDFSTPHGMPVRATADGTISSAGYESGWGNLVRIDHGFSIMTFYAHLSKTAVNPSQEVRRGDIIGYTGNTGRSTGTHLHYGANLDGQPVDPLKFLNANQATSS